MSEIPGATPRRRGRPKGSVKVEQIPLPDGQKFNISQKKASAFYQIKELRLIHNRIIGLKVSNPELKDKVIANVLGVSAAMVGYTLGSELGKQKIRSLTYGDEATLADMKEYIQSLGPLAISTLEEVMMEGMHDGHKLRAAESALKYIIQEAGTNIRHQHEHKITEDDIDLMRARLSEHALLGPADSPLASNIDEKEIEADYEVIKKDSQ